jgi:hypothetical protein
MKRTTQVAQKVSKSSLINRTARPRLALPKAASSINFEIEKQEWQRGGSRRTFFGLGEVMGVLSK